jgi:hypothetical protein
MARNARPTQQERETVQLIHSTIQRRCADTEMTVSQVDQASMLAAALYDTAGRHGVTKSLADGVTSFIDAAIDGIRARDRVTS